MSQHQDQILWPPYSHLQLLPGRPEFSSSFGEAYDTVNVQRDHGVLPHAAADPLSLRPQQTNHHSYDEGHEARQHANPELSPPTDETTHSAHDTIIRSSSLLSEPWAKLSSEASISRAASLKGEATVSSRSSLETVHEHEHDFCQALGRSPSAPQTNRPSMAVLNPPRKPYLKRHSSLRHETRPSDDNLVTYSDPARTLNSSRSESYLSAASVIRPKSHPLSRVPVNVPDAENACSNSFKRFCLWEPDDPWRLPPLNGSMLQTPQLSHSVPSRRPSLTFKHLSSLDKIIKYREDRESWRRESYASAQQPPTPISKTVEPVPSMPPMVETCAVPQSPVEKPLSPVDAEACMPSDSTCRQNRFRHFAAEVGFCFTIAMTQFLAEYLISGFAIVLPSLFQAGSSHAVDSTGLFWPAALLSLILSAFLLVFARISDMYGGYGPFMFGLIWLTIWTLVPGFVSSSLLLNVSRAMQGFAIAAFTPSTFSMVGSIYAEGPRRNVVLGLYGACAPLGFFAGFLAGGALPESEAKWYFWIASALAFITAVTAYLSVPSDRTDRRCLNLKMDWLGAFLITSGLILVTYALSVQPYANASDLSRDGFSFRIVYAPLSAGAACLLTAFWVEGWYADCPLLPFEFFRPRGVKSLSVACLFFYGSFGVWLYNSAEYFVSPTVTQDPDSIKGIMLSLWYTPMAVGGIVFCVVGGSLLHIVPIKLLMIISGLSWIGAPLVFAVGPIPLTYWSEVLPSMICGTLGIDLTFTIATIFLSSTQPLKFQGVAGAVSSILVNLAMSFSLPISLIVKEAAAAHARDDTIDVDHDATVWGFRAAFIYGAASAAIGLLICIFFVRISRAVVSGKRVNRGEKAVSNLTSTASTVVESDAVRRSYSV